MSITTITINSIDYQAYASVAEADAFLAVDQVRGAVWATKDTDTKGALLVAATRGLDVLDFAGEPAGGSEQETKWPRTGVSHPDGTAVADSVVPLAVERACCLLAGTLASTPKAGEAGGSSSNQKSVKAGSVRVEFFRPTAGKPLRDETAFNIVRPYLASHAVSSSLGNFASGITAESVFETEDTDYNLSDGLY